MAKVKAGTVSVEIMLDKDQFDKDWKAAQREVADTQKKLSMEMQRNRVKFEVDGIDKGWADKLFGGTVIGKVSQARKEMAFLNEQMGMQKTKTDVARNAWQSMLTVKGQLSAATQSAEKAYLREQMALANIRKEMNGTASASSVMAGAVKNTAAAVAAAVGAMAVSYAVAIKSAAAWGQAVNDIADETGMADAEAAKLLGTMNIVGLSAEDASGSLAKMAKTVATAKAAQDAANRAGRESEDVFTKYGIAITDTGGNLLSYSDILANITTVHRSMRDGMEKTAMEMEIFGRSGYKLNDLLNMTGERSAEIEAKLGKLGLTVGFNSQKFEDFNIQLNESKLALQSIANTITGDDVPAVSAFVGKLTDLAIWIRENKAAIDEMRGFGGAILDVIKPFDKQVDFIIGKLKSLVEARSKTLGMQDFVEPGMPTEADVATQNKILDDARKKNNEAVLAKLKSDKDVKQSSQELQTAVLEMQGYTLAASLDRIEKERQAWAKKTQDEVASTQWAEAAKQKAYEESQARMQSALNGIRSAFQGAYGTAISKVEDAIRTGSSSSWRAAEDAIRQMKEDLRIKTEASRAVARAAGYDEESIQSGAYDPMSASEAMQQAFKGFNEAVKSGSESVRKEIELLRQDLKSGGTGGSKSGGGQSTGGRRPGANNSDDIFSPSYSDQMNAEAMSKVNREQAELQQLIHQNMKAGNTVQFYPKSQEDLARINATAKESLRRDNEEWDRKSRAEAAKYWPQAQTVNVPVTVNVNGMDAQSAQQLGEIAAQQMIPAVQSAIGSAATQYKK